MSIVNEPRIYTLDFWDEFRKYINIYIPEETIIRLEALARLIAGIKVGEDGYRSDNHGIYKRHLTGLVGEAALEIFLKCYKIINWAAGPSNKFDNPDLTRIGLNMGVKAVESGKYHVIHLHSIRPEIICTRMDRNNVLICGIANVEVLNTSQDIKLILSQTLRDKGTKTGFYGYHHDDDFMIMEDLRNYEGKKWFTKVSMSS